MTDPTLRDQIVRALEKHRLSPSMGGTASIAWCDCSCGTRVEAMGAPREHADQLGLRHQADAVLPIVQQAQAQALRDAQADMNCWDDVAALEALAIVTVTGEDARAALTAARDARTTP